MVRSVRKQYLLTSVWLLKGYGGMFDCPYSVLIRCIVGSSRIASLHKKNKTTNLSILTRDSICKYSYASGRTIISKMTSRNRLTLENKLERRIRQRKKVFIWLSLRLENNMFKKHTQVVCTEVTWPLRQRKRRRFS